MKKYIIAIVFALGFGMNVNAQSDGFFTSGYTMNRETPDPWGTMPSMIGHGLDGDQNANAPIGSGLLLLAGMGLGYAAMRRKRD